MTTSVDLDDLSLALDFVSVGGPGEHRAYVSIDSGAIYWVADTIDVDDDTPDDLEESDRYIPVPSKPDLDLGRSLVLRFTDEHLPDAYGTVRGYFARRGAYGRFKDLLARRSQLDAWHAFEAMCTEQALRDWCDAHGFAVTRRDASSTPGATFH